jgi:hypothetical protein
MNTLFSGIVLLGVPIGASNPPSLTAEVQQTHGSPLLLVNGKPQSPLMFFGWAHGARPTPVDVMTAWRWCRVSFIAPEDNNDHCGVHVRVSTGPGTVWIDDAVFCEGGPQAVSQRNMLHCGDWECDRAAADKAWTLFVKCEAGAKADWRCC